MPDRPLRLLGLGSARSLSVLRWARRLVERGHEVHLVSGRLNDRAEELEGVHVHDVRRLEPLMRVPGVRSRRIGTAIGKLARDLDVDLVHAHYLLPYGWWGARSGVHPLVMSPWSRDIFVDNREGRGKRRAGEAMRAADWFVLNSRANEEVSIELGADPERITHIIWYSEVERFGPEHADPGLRARFGWPDDALVVLSLRNFLPYKNIDVVVRAFAEASRAEPRARLLLCARAGPLREEIERLVDDLGLRDRVAFFRAEWDVLPNVVASGDVAVTIADTDSTPASLLEVMKSELPVVCGIAPSMDEWVDQGEGAEMVPCRDVDAVAAAMKKLLADPGLRRAYGERNARVVQELLPEPPGDALERLYRELVAR